MKKVKPNESLFEISNQNSINLYSNKEFTLTLSNGASDSSLETGLKLEIYNQNYRIQTDE